MKTSSQNSLILALTCIYSFIWIWQGLDFLDHGYWATAYQQFISYPGGIGDGAIACWGTLAIGYVWQQLFGSFGFVSFKLAYVVVNLIAFFIAYYAMKDVFPNNKTILLFATFVTFLFITKKTGIIGYNNLTALFYLLGGVLIFLSLKKQSMLLMLFAGLVMGFNFFIRLPNILGILLITTIWLHAYVEKWSIKKLIHFSAIFIIGYIAIIISFFLIMNYMEHLQYYVYGVRSILKLVSSTDGGYSSGFFLRLLIRDYSLALFSGAICIFASIFFTKKITYFPGGIKWSIIFILAFVAVPILGFKHIGGWLIPGIIYIVLLTSLFFQVKSKEKLATLTYIALAILALAPLGSNNGMWNAYFDMWLALPLMLMTIYEIGDINFRGLDIKAIEIKIIYQTFIMVILVFSLVTIFTSTYHDSKNRFQMTYEVKHPLLKNVLTTEERAVVVQELLDELTKHMKPNDYLLAYNRIPMIHYLTNTKPWLGSSWPSLYSTNRIKTLLEDKVAKNENLPLIVRANGNVSNKDWPIGINLIEDNYHNSKELRKLFDEFIIKHNYNSIWKNNFFEILSP